jgi:hypothetical protein
MDTSEFCPEEVGAAELKGISTSKSSLLAAPAYPTRTKASALPRGKLRGSSLAKKTYTSWPAVTRCNKMYKVAGRS